MTRLTKYTIQLISGLLLALLTAGCVADRNVSDCITEGEDVELEFAVQVPALETSLRQLDATQEQAVRNIQLLVFNTQDESGQDLDEPNETFAYEAEVKSKTQEGNTIRIRCALKASPDKPMRVVCIANAPTKIITTDFTNKTKQTILEDDQMKKNFTAAWPTDGSKFIPMWGESDKQPVSRNTKFNSCDITGLGGTGVNKDNEGVIHLVRALARIDVGVSFENDPASEKANGNTDFKIKSVRVYRYATSMYMTGTQSTTFYFNGTTREAKPHTPAGVGTAADATPLKFEAAKGGVNGYVRNIYIPEISNQGDKNKRTCLVIGGYYNNSDKETFYRVDFIHTDKNASGQETTKQLDVLRNHRYRFNITKIKGPGTSTPGEALITEPVNITCDVVVWDEAKIDQIVYDGQYYLAVSKDKFHFGKNKANDSYTIRTNWPKGYKIVDKDGNEWPKTEQAAKDSGKWFYFTEPANQTFKEGKDMSSTINVLENDTRKDRNIKSGDLFVQAGRIKWPLVVSQSNKVELDIKIYLKESESWQTDCAKEPINAHTCVPGTEYFFWVKYTEGAKVGRVQVDRDEQFTWHKVSDDPKQGIALYKAIVDQKNVPQDDFWLSEVSKFRAVKDEAETSTDFTLNYMKWDAIPYKDAGFTHNMLDRKREPVYVLSDFNQRFYIRANAPYNLTIEGTNGIVIQKLSGNPVESQLVKGWNQGKLIQEKIQPAFVEGEQVNFQTFDHIGDKDKVDLGNNRIVSALVNFIISPKAREGEPGYFKPHKFTIHFVAGILQPEANTYVVEAGTLPILIPCSQINKAADWWDDQRDDLNRMMQDRIKAGGGQEPGFTWGVYENYVDQNAENATEAARIKKNKEVVPLPRLKEDDKDWTAQPVWSTLRSTPGNDSGLKRVEAVQLSIGCKNYILVTPRPEYEGCVLVSAVKGYNTAKPKILWNWTIWVVKKVKDGGHGYPWDDADNGQRTKPYMNRNLGAYRMAAERARGVAYDIYNNDMAGLYYKHGTPVPHHAYEEQGAAATKGSHCTKVWYNQKLVPDQAQTRMSPNLYGMTAAKTMCSMHDIINKPTQMIARNLQSEYIMEFGTSEWGAYTKKRIWQGGDAASILNNERGFANFSAKTDKTPFDPSPYGWKVPSAGEESLELCNHPYMVFARTGGFLAGWYNTMNIGSEGNNVALHVATCYANSDALVFNYYDLGQQRWTHTVNGGIISGANTITMASSQIPIRCIENEKESDYRDYTAAGVMQNARSATKAVRRYYRR